MKWTRYPDENPFPVTVRLANLYFFSGKVLEIAQVSLAFMNQVSALRNLRTFRFPLTAVTEALTSPVRNGGNFRAT